MCSRSTPRPPIRSTRINPIPDEAPPAAGTSEDEGQVIQEFQESAAETQKLEREQAKEDAAEVGRGGQAPPDRGRRPRARAGDHRARTPTRATTPTRVRPVNPDTQTTTLPSEVEPNQPVAPDPKECTGPDGTTRTRMSRTARPARCLPGSATDRERAEDALEVEKDGKQRSTLIGHLEQIAAD